jgi:hypothetical protein
MKAETVERMAEDARSVRGAITFYAGRHRVSAVFEKGSVIYRVNGWPADEAYAARILELLQTGLPVKLPG